MAETFSSYICLCVVIAALQLVAGQPQSFREAPSDSSVIRGQTAVLACRVDHMKGHLQWTKDDVALGYDRGVPGFPTYSMVGSEDRGENDLMIRDVTLDDDAEFECQVSPAEGSPAIRDTAVLSVLIPPEHPEIEGHVNGSVVQVPHQQETVTLTCTSRNGKPAATLSWQRNGEDLVAAGTTVIEATTEVLDNKLQNAQSALTFEPHEEDNEAFYACAAQNEALTNPLRTIVQLSVMHPPQQPEINGYHQGQVVRRGDTLKLVCIARGGNPLAQVYWYRNGLGLDFSFSSGDEKAENILAFTVQPTDNNALYRCEASNLVTPEPLTAEVKLVVQFGPEEVVITGKEHGKAGETIKLKCESAISNPAAVLNWNHLGNMVPGSISVTKPSPKGGFVTTSEVDVTLTSQVDISVYQCSGANEVLGHGVTSSITLKVVYPPGHPTISGFIRGKTVQAGNIHTMTCMSMGGNPTATLTWWKGDNLIEGTSRITGNMVQNQVSFILRPDDNGAAYRCNATNPATVTPLLTSVALNVSFPPASVDISTRPQKGRKGSPLTILCASGSSNPASNLTWLKNGANIAGMDTGVIDSENGGWSTLSELQLLPTEADDGQIYACQAMNALISRAVSDAVTLDITYAPVFPEGTPTKVDVIEYESAFVNLTGKGNPADIQYVWYKDGTKLTLGGGKVKRAADIPHFLQDGGLLNITNVTRADSGLYVLEAGNTEGKTNFEFFVNVQYSAAITRISQNLLTDQGETASLECVVTANPLEASMVTWSRTGYDMAKTVTQFAEGRSVLKVANVTKEDSGLFTCTAENGIGEKVESAAQLLVKYAPEIDKSPTYSKAAADKGSTAKLICKAEGAPNVDFFWLKDATALDGTGTKYKVESNKPGLVQYESSLQVFNTSKTDYGAYKCLARNDLGQDEWMIHLDGTSKPDPPYNLQVVNATHNSITLSWRAGFDGGSTQRFQVRYVESGAVEGHKYADVVPTSATVFTITGLKLAVEYEMAVRAINRLGESGYQEVPIKAKTSAMTGGGMAGDEVPLIIILVVSIVGMFLLGLNVLLILFFIRRRRRKLAKAASESSSQANTLEMFNAPTITEDTKSYATYDQRSIEGYPDELYNKHYDDDDEMRRFLGTGPGPYEPYGPPAYPGPYPPYQPSRNEYSPTPGGTLPPPYLSHRPTGGPRDPIYMDDRLAMDQGWAPRQEPYPGGTLPRRGVTPHEDEEEDDYTEQLRKMQKNIGGSQLYLQNGSTSNLGPPLSGRVPPPPPPARPSDGPRPQPPVPSRHYGPEDTLPHRYSMPPGGEYGRGGPPPPDIRGQLV